MKIRTEEEQPESAPFVVHFALKGKESEHEVFSAEVERTQFEASPGSSLLRQDGDTWFLLVGAGDGSGDAWRQAGAAVASKASSLHFALAALDVATLGVRELQLLIEGIALGGYKFDRYIAQETREKQQKLEELVLITSNESAAETAATGQRSAEAVIFARDIANEPPEVCTPEFLASHARELAETFGFECTIFDEAELEEQGFALISAVGRGSVNPPRLIHLRYTAPGGGGKHFSLVGKGVTYDSGGYSMKPSSGQINMHLDMGGSAAVLGAAYAIGSAKPEGVVVDFIVPTAENLVAHNAFKVMDIIRSYSGKTVEIHNTDAEGRLLLADALAYAEEQEPDVILDLATLTGSCVVGLGMETAGVFGTDTRTTKSFLDAADRSAERVWELPLVDRIKEQLKSEVADVKNIGGKWGGAISAALFLQNFVEDTPWVHVDLAGPAMTDSAWSWINKGGTGFGVLALEEWITGAREGQASA